jgi:hypothetical protein
MRIKAQKLDRSLRDQCCPGQQDWIQSNLQGFLEDNYSGTAEVSRQNLRHLAAFGS